MGLPFPVEAALHVHFDRRAFVYGGFLCQKRVADFWIASAISWERVVSNQPALRTSREWPGRIAEPGRGAILPAASSSSWGRCPLQAQGVIEKLTK